MNTVVHRAMSCTMLVVFLAPGSARADEPRVEVKVKVVQIIRGVDVDVQALPPQAVIEVEAVAEEAVKLRPAQPAVKAVKAEPAKNKPKAPAAAIDIEALVAPFVEALEGKLDLNAVNDQNRAQMQQWIPQFTQQFKPMLMSELNFIRQNCELAPEQRPKIKAAGEAALKEAARKMAEQQVQPQARGSQADPRRTIRDGLAKALKETLSAGQMTKYTEESDKRTALRKRAAILNVVARLDTVMCLNSEQRTKITDSISSAWQDKWEQWLALSIYGDQYYPTVPDQLLVSHLNAEQKAVWSGLQKVDFGFWNGGGEAEQNDGWWGDEPAKPAAAPRAGIGFF